MFFLLKRYNKFLKPLPSLLGSSILLEYSTLSRLSKTPIFPVLLAPNQVPPEQ